MKKNIETLLEAIKRHGFFETGRCSICDYPLGYFVKDDKLYFDSGCNCIKGEPVYKEVSFSDLERYLDEKETKKFIKLKKLPAPKIIRKQEEIIDHIEKCENIFGWQKDDLILYLSFKNIKKMDIFKEEYIKDIELGKEKWKKLTNPLKEIKDYMPFAFNKALNKRGISAERSINHMLAWVWLINDKLYQNIKDSYEYEYCDYGMLILKMICHHFKIDYSDFHNYKLTNEQKVIVIQRIK